MPPPRAEYEKTLSKLAALLKRAPMTAKEIADHFNTCKPIAYKRLRALKKRGVVLFETPAPRSSTGPKAKSYGIR